MTREETPKGRRSKQENGSARSNTPWTVKAIEPHTKQRIAALSFSLGTTIAHVIDIATKRLADELLAEDNENGRKGNTLSATTEMYASLLFDKEQPRTSPELIELKKRLQKRRERLKCDLAGKQYEVAPVRPPDILEGN